MNFPLTIKSKRRKLGETKTEFGNRFDVSHAAVSDWESGKSEAPYRVLDFCLEASEPKEKECVHSWRQITSQNIQISGGSIVERFYCIKCLKKSQ